MTQSSAKDLLARLAGARGSDDQDAWAGLDATSPDHDGHQEAPTLDQWDKAEQRDSEAKLDKLLSRIADLTGNAGRPAAQDENGDFLPVEPDTLEEAQLTEVEVESLMLKFLLAKGSATGRDCADQVRLAFKIVERLLTQLKAEQLVFLRDIAPMNDYYYQLSDMGRERAKRYAEHCTYFGSAPVSLRDYIQSVAAQSLTTQHPTSEDLERAFEDLLMNKRMLNRLGPAVNSGRGLFLYGAPGNGKTSIAERVTKSFGDLIWIPRAIGVDGEIIRLYDPSNHDAVPDAPTTGLLDQRRIDKRWIRVRRPTIVVGGELTMNSLEVAFNRITGISEAPLQLKSNCGTLVIDDFGRQRMSTDELLNRWIVPLEKRYDFLNLSNGKKIQVPFDQLIVFSTNLEPRDLVDEAFLRRIPYKIEVVDPTEEEFRELFKLMAEKMQVAHDEKMVAYVIEKHYRQAGRPFRYCHPRDLLLQVRNFCRYRNMQMEMTEEYFDFAVENYFAVV